MDSDFVERPKVDAQPKGAIVLLDEVGFQNPITGARNDNIFGEYVSDGSIDWIVVEGGMSTGSQTDNNGLPGTNGMLYKERDSRSMSGLEG